MAPRNLEDGNGITIIMKDKMKRQRGLVTLQVSNLTIVDVVFEVLNYLIVTKTTL